MDASTRCFRCHRRPRRSPTELRVSICRHGHGDHCVHELLSEWRKTVAVDATINLAVELQNGWPNTDATWAELCNFVKETSPQIHGFSTTLSLEVDDEKWVSLLRHLPNNLLELSITTLRETPLTYDCIGRSFRELQTMTVHHGDGCPLFVPRIRLPHVIESLPALKCITLWNLPEISYQVSWKQLVRAFQSREQLVEANIFQGYTLYGRPSNPLSDQDMDAIQFRPRVNEAIQQVFLDGSRLPKSLEEFVDVLVAVQDRVDCLDYFFSTADPSLFAPSAITIPERGRESNAQHERPGIDV